jgi:hypothetical protein
MTPIDGGGHEGNVDNIVVDAVPLSEPASIVLLGGALAGIGVWRRRNAAASRGC